MSISWEIEGPHKGNRNPGGKLEVDRCFPVSGCFLLEKIWSFSRVWVKQTSLFTTALHGNIAYLPILLCLSAYNNLYFLYLWKITPFEKPDPPSPLAQEELIIFCFLCALPTQCCIITKCLQRCSLILWDKLWIRSWMTWILGLPLAISVIFNKTFVLTWTMQITLASPAWQTGLNEMFLKELVNSQDWCLG